MNYPARHIYFSPITSTGKLFFFYCNTSTDPEQSSFQPHTMSTTILYTYLITIIRVYLCAEHKFCVVGYLTIAANTLLSRWQIIVIIIIIIIISYGSQSGALPCGSSAKDKRRGPPCVRLKIKSRARLIPMTLPRLSADFDLSLFLSLYPSSPFSLSFFRSFSPLFLCSTSSPCVSFSGTRPRSDRIVMPNVENCWILIVIVVLLDMVECKKSIFFTHRAIHFILINIFIATFACVHAWFTKYDNEMS